MLKERVGLSSPYTCHSGIKRWYWCQAGLRDSKEVTAQRLSFAGFPLTYMDTYQNALTTTVSTCFTQSNVSSICCSQANSDVSYQFSLIPPSYWAFSIAPAIHSMSLTVSAFQSTSLVGVLNLEPFSGITQSSLGMTGSAMVMNLPSIYEASNTMNKLLFIDSNNPLDQGIPTPSHIEESEHP